MKLKYTIASSLAFMVWSCTNDISEIPVSQVEGNFTLKATIESVTTRAAIDEGKISWSIGDKINALLSDN